MSKEAPRAESISQTTRFLFGAIGPAQSLREFSDIMKETPFQEAFPDAELAGVIVLDGELLSESGPLGSLVFDSPEALIRQTPDLDFMLDFSGDLQVTQNLRALLPGNTSLLRTKQARLLYELMLSKGRQAKCELDLLYSRSLFQTIFNEVEEDILLLDLEGRILDMNRNTYERKGKTKDEYLHTGCWELEGMQFCCDSPDVSCPFKDTVLQGKKSESVHSFVDDDGRLRYYRVYTYPVFNAEKQLTNILEIRRDITNRTNMELRLQQSEKMAAIGELSTYIAHEIRNPLFAIGGFANSLLRSKNLSEMDREKVSIILEESKRLDKILKSTLNFAKPTDAKEGKIDLNNVVQETMDLLSFGFETKGVTPHAELTPHIALVKGDPELLKQCLINLVKNASEAMPDGGDLYVRTRMGTDHVLLEIEDTGCGIPAEIRSKVFNPFFSTKEKGAGLGLAMTKKIVEEMGGSVELNSQPGTGTTISLFLLPLLAVDENVPGNISPI